MSLSRKRLLETAASFGLIAATSATVRAAAATANTVAANAVAGAWKLESFVIETAGKSGEPRFGPNPVGYLIYTPSGRMSATLMAAHRSTLQSPKGATSTHAELTESLADFLAYAGRYEVRGNHVFHHIEVSVFTNLVGTTLEREFTISGDTLTIRTLPPEIWGTANRLVWTRT
ncbi:MAG: lipocalin-like domain-containing protein [Candidatus Tumulicola sp.]